MQNTEIFNRNGLHSPGTSSFHNLDVGISRKVVIGLILVVALFAFELFNFDTTRFALRYLLGDVSFWGMHWSTILAVAFCAIDFAGLARLFTPEQGKDEPQAVWYLMGAWLLGATMNALMTWWAVSLTLLSHDFGNEVLSRQQLLQIVPIFVAALVWLTRILFIGALSFAGEHLLERDSKPVPERAQRARADRAIADRPQARELPANARPLRQPVPASSRRPQPAATRVNRRVPMPSRSHQVPAGMHARGRSR